jgi:transposase
MCGVVHTLRIIRAKVESKKAGNRDQAKPRLSWRTAAHHPHDGRKVLQQGQAMSVWRVRHDRFAANYRTFIKLASIRIWLRADEAAP